MKKQHVVVIAALLGVAFLVGLVAAPYLGVQPSTSDERIGVIVTILPQAEFVEQIGKDNIRVTVLVPPGASPHAYEPTPGQMKDVCQAKMYAKVGSGVEFELVWVEKLIDTNKDMLIVDCSEGIELMGADPHIWLAPQYVIKMVENIRDGLMQVDPTNANYYEQNAAAYIQTLTGLDAEIQASLEGVKSRTFMVFHPAWGYFARDYELEQIPIAVEGKEPSAQDIANLIETANEKNITVIFVSPQFNPKSAEVIAEAIGGRVVFINPLARDYVTNMRVVTAELVQGLS